MVCGAVILNGVSRRKKKFYREILPELLKKFALEIFETQWKGHAEELTSQHAGRFDFVLAAGGDGTLSEVVNGILQNEQLTHPSVGLVPLGTGNDFARVCNLTASAPQILDLLTTSNPKPTDVGVIICHDRTGKKIRRYFINDASIGMGPEVVNRLEKNSRFFGPSLTYFKAIAETFLMHKPQEVHCITPDWEWQGKVRVLAIANGKSFGNSIYIAPDAIPDDGVLNSFIAGDLPLWKFLLYLQSIKSQKKIQDKFIHYNQTTQMELRAPEPCAIETDGELVGYLPAKLEILSKRIDFFR
jgi:diacylglycerol kinase (ATP)